MKPPAFDYVAAETVEQAVALLAEHDGEAKIIAGGQSLVPMLNFRLLAPTVLIDINRIEGLAGIEETGTGLRIGALTRHHVLETSPLIEARFPVLHAAMQHVAHLAIRNRGTIGGSISHADPAAELPSMMRLLDATINVLGPGGARQVDAHEFFDGALTTTLEEDEIVTAIDLPALPEEAGWGFEEFARRSGDFAMAGVAAILAVDAGKVAEARIALMGVDETPMRADAAEALLTGKTLDDALISEAAAAARDGVEPTEDLHASPEYRRRLVTVLTERVLKAASRRAQGEVT